MAILGYRIWLSTNMLATAAISRYRPTHSYSAFSNLSNFTKNARAANKSRPARLSVNR